MLVVLTRQTTTRTSEVVRPVRCPMCGCEYVYRDELVSEASTIGVYGLGHNDVSRKLADDQKLQRKVEFTPVPCPRCFRYPEYMAERLRQDRKSGRVVPGCLYLVGAVVVGVLAWFLGGITQSQVMRVCLGAGAGVLGTLSVCYVVARVRAQNYEPNDARHLAERQEEARELAMSREEFEEVQRQEARKVFDARLADAGEWGDGTHALLPVSVPVWLGYSTDANWQDQPVDPPGAEVTLPTGERWEFELPEDVREFDEFDVKRTVDGVRVVFRCVVRFYHPTQRVPGQAR